MKTIFEGTINGEKFNSVQEYNARMIELMNAGAEVNATSRTKSVNESAGCDRSTCDMSHDTAMDGYKRLINAICSDDETDPDEEITLYPYFNDDEPYYLDVLVDDNVESNEATRNVVADTLNVHWSEIVEFLNCEDVCVCDKKEYLNDVHDIIASITRDRKVNTEALSKINQERIKADADFAKAKMEYENTMKQLASNEAVLNGATNIINDMLNFYQAVESEGTKVVNDSNKNCNCIDKSCNENQIKTNVKEASPQVEMDLANALGKLWGHLMSEVDPNVLKTLGIK
jgi:hypothetical protein